MHNTPYIVDHNNNNLYIVKHDISTDPANLFYTIKHTIKGLRPWEGRHLKDESYNIAAKSGIDVLSAEETAHLLKTKKAELHVALVRFTEDGHAITDGIVETGPGDTAAWTQSQDNEEEEEWQEFREQWKRMFQPPSGIPPPSRYPFRIRTDPTARDPYRAPYRFSPREHEEFEKQIKLLMSNGWVTRSHSRFAAPVLFVKKPHTVDELRMCIDYRALNAITEKDRFPLPNMEDLIDRLHGATIFTTLDLATGYHQMRIEPEDTFKTAFISPSGLYEWKVLPLGLANAPAAFMRLMGGILSKFSRFCIVYLDDILIFSKTVEEHRQHVQDVLHALDQAGLKLKASKCHFGKSSVLFVGFKVDRHGIHMAEDKVRAIKEWGTPQTPTDLKAFLGLAGFYRRFIRHFAHTALPLYELVNVLPKDFQWTPIHNQAFKNLKDKLSAELVISLLEPGNRDFIVCTDASNFAIGATLQQTQKRVIAYYSRKLHGLEI